MRVQVGLIVLLTVVLLFPVLVWWLQTLSCWQLCCCRRDMGVGFPGRRADCFPPSLARLEGGTAAVVGDGHGTVGAQFGAGLSSGDGAHRVGMAIS